MNVLFKGSWKTTSAGLALIIGALVHLWFTRMHLDETSVMGGIMGILGGIGLLVARDNDKTSEEVGAGGPGAGGGAAAKLGLIFLGLLGWTLLAGGCANTPGQVIYKTEATTHVGVTEAMGLWNVYVGQFHPGTNDEIKVKAAFEKWQAGTLAVCDAGALYAAAVTTNATGATGVSGVLEQAISTADQEKTDLLNLLTQLGVKVP